MGIIQLGWPSLGALLDDAAGAAPDQPLLIYEGASMTFRQLRDRVNRLANVLISLGVRHGDRVSVMLPNGFDFPSAWLAIARIGAVMVPTNIGYQAHDLSYVLRDSGAVALLIDSTCLPVLEAVRPGLPDLRHVLAAGERVAGYDYLDDRIAAASPEPPAVEAGPDDLANIQYTSGTTGFPKGCMLTHRYWLTLAHVATHYYQFVPQDVFLTAQPFYYMDPQWNLVLCLMHRCPLVIMHRFSPSRFWQTVRDNGVTFFYVLGTMPFFLMKLPEDPVMERGHKVRLIACSGIHPAYHAEFERRWGAPWREVFGMTESGVDLVVPVDDAGSVGSGAMGKPTFARQARAVDHAMSDVPDGSPGELVLRGEGLMLGYWNNPEATAEAMRGGWLHTGDLVTRDPQGYYHWVGRLKDMIRRAGENISTAEVEGVLVRHPKVRLAAAVPVPDDLRGEEVKVYIVLQPGETPETAPPEDLLSFARAQLAKFKVPRYIEYVDDLPRTPSERVEKHRLIAARPDLREGSYDAVEGRWR